MSVFTFITSVLPWELLVELLFINISYFSRRPRKDPDPSLADRKVITTGWLHWFSSSIKATAVHYQILGWLCQICLLKVVFSFKHCYCINTNLSRWGASQKDGTSQEHLQEVELEYICNRECQRQFKSATIFGESALKWCFKSTQERHLWRKGMDSWNWWRNQWLHVMCRCKVPWYMISFFVFTRPWPAFGRRA